MTYVAFVLDEPSRAALLAACPARHKDETGGRTIAHHVTILFPTSEDDDVLGTYEAFKDVTRVVVYEERADDRAQAVFVAVCGNKQRVHGGEYHVTVSIAKGAKPVMSNQLTRVIRPLQLVLTGDVKLVD